MSSAEDEAISAQPSMSTLRELGLLFLRLGTTAFGGPAAHIAMMQDEVVRRRSWLTQQDFLDLLGATNLIPGPNSNGDGDSHRSQTARVARFVVAGTCFIVPATLIVGVLAYLYVSYGSLPKVKGILYGVKPAIIAVIFQALYSLGRTALKSRGLAVVATASVGAVLVGIHELVVLGSAGLLVMLKTWPARRGQMFCDVSGLSLFPVVMLSTATYVKPFANTAAIIHFLCESRFRVVWQRVCAARFPPSGSGRTMALAHGSAIA